MNYRPDIDGLRAVAVGGVLVSHAGVPALEGGFLGVDVFFVISGYLITNLILNDLKQSRFSYGVFYLRRVRRLFPALAFTIVISLAFFLPILSPRDLESFLKSVPAAIVSLSNFFFWDEVGYFDIGADFKPLLHTWSLSVEEQFYLIWPTTLVLLFGVMRRHLLALLLLSILVSVAAAGLLFEQYPDAVYYLLPFRVFELMIGAVLTQLPQQTTPRPWHEVALLGGLTAIGASFVLFDSATPSPGPLTLLPCLGTALVIVGGRARYASILLTNRVCVGIGLISYSLYLIHWPVYTYYRYRSPSEPWGLAEQVVLIAIAIALAVLMYRFVETPFRRVDRAAPMRSHRPFLAACATLAMAISIPTVLNRYPALLGTASASTPQEMQQVRLDVPVTSTGKTLPVRRFTAPNAKARVLMIGDSHADALRPGLVALFSARGISLDISDLPGCPPLFGVYKIYGEQSREETQERCRDDKAMWEALTARPEYDAVILASRWFWLFEPNTYREVSFRRDYLATYDPTEPVDADRSRALFDASLQRTVEAIRAHGKRVVVFSQVPAFGNDLNRCLSLFPWERSNETPRGRCNHLTYAEQIERAAHTDRTIGRLAAGDDHVLPVVATELMCRDGRCPFADEDGESLYKDADHLSEAGSRRFIAKVDDKLGLADFVLGLGRPQTSAAQ